MGSHRFADILPSHAARAAALDRRGAAKLAGLSAMVKDGRLELELPRELERHRAATSALGKWNGVIGGSKMIADPVLYEAAIEASDRQCATGARWPRKPLDGGVPAIGGNMILRWSNPLTAAELNVRGYRAPEGPVLDSAPWDDVLVVEARSNDGESLQLRAEPFEGPVAEATLSFRQLRAGATYSLTVGGTRVSMVADADGRATCSCAITAPTSIEVRPS
jgi:hypothetical protein